MAFASQGSMGTGSSKTSGTTVTVASTSQTANVGDLVLVLIAADNLDTSDIETTRWSVEDSTGANTYTRVGEYVNGEGAAASGVQVALFYSRLTTQLASGGSITGTINSAITAKAIRAWRFTVDNAVVVDTSASPANFDQADPGSMTISGLAASTEFLFLRAGAVESDNSVGTYAATSGFTAIGRIGTSGGGEQTNVSSFGEFLISTATSATSNPSFSGGTTRDNSNWFVAFKEQASSTPLTISVSDNAANWSDTLTNLGYGALITENMLNLLDNLTILGYGHLITDDLAAWADAHTLGYGRELVFADDSFNLTDAFEKLLIGFFEIATADNLLNLADSIATLGYGHLLTDSINNWLEYLALDHGLLFTDTLVLSDTSLQILHHLVSKDDAMTLSDFAEAAIVYNTALADSLNNWLDALVLGYGHVLTDDINSWLDSQALGHGLLFTDNLNNLADAIALQFDYLIVKTDDALNLSDYQLLSTGHIFEDLMALSDSFHVAIGRLQEAADDLNNWLDAEAHSLDIYAGSQLNVNSADSLNNWNDAFTKFSAWSISIGDTLNNWLDAITLRKTLVASDDLNRFQDSIRLIKSSLMSFTDSLNAWNDAVQLRATVNISANDSLNNWGEAVSKFLASFGQFKDTINNWDDLAIVRIGKLRGVADNLNSWNDVAIINSSLLRAFVFSDSLNNWNDDLNVLASAVLDVNTGDYLRRFLNDVDGPESDTPLSSGSAGAESDLTDYLRNYLNDKTRV